MAFQKNTFAFDLDIKRQSKTKVFPVEGDTANQFVITLKDNGAAMNLTGLYVRAVYKRSDGVVVTQGETHPDAPLTVNKASGIVTVNVMNGAFRDGDNYLELQVLSGSATSGTVMVTSPQVLLRARNCILTDDAVAASSEVSELNEYLAALAGMNITVTMLEATASPTGTITLEDGAYQIALGIPRGAKITSASLSGTTLTFSLDDGSSVAVSLTGIATQSWVNSQDFLTSPVENGDLDTMEPLTIKGNDTQSTHAPKDLSKAEIKAMFPMVGATAGANGSAGFVPAPTSGDKDFFLAGDGTWREPASERGELKIKVDNTVVTLTSLSTGDYLSKAMTFINLLIANKQNTLTAGYGITISGQNSNNISAPSSPVIVTVNDATLSDIVGHASAGRIVVCEMTTSGATVRGLLRYYDDTSAVFYDVDADNTQATMWVVDSNDDWTESTVSLGGGGGGAVDSVNGQTGTVVLDAEDVGAMPSAAIDALLALLSKVAYTDDDGQQYLDTLEDALYNRTLSSISAVFTQGGATITPNTPLDDLKQYLVVTANYSDNTSKTVTDYTLSGTLAVGTSTITVTYRGKTDTFTVTVSAAQSYVSDGLVAFWDGINNTGSAHDSSAIKWIDTINGYEFVHNGSGTKTYAFGDDCLNFTTTASGSTATPNNTLKCANIGLARTVEVVFKATGSTAQCIGDFSGDSWGNNETNNKYCFSVFPADDTVMVQGGASGGNMQSTGLANVRSLSGTYDTSHNCTAHYINGSTGVAGTHTHSFSGQTSGYMILGASPNNYAYPLQGKVYAIRIYNRELTAAEIAQNYAVDKSRYNLE